MRSVLLPVLFLSAPLGAQAPAPPAELARLDPLLGNWKGSGVSRHGPEGKPVPWTSLSTVKRILGGHVLQEDLQIQAGTPKPLVFRTLYWWDADRRRIRFFGMSNMGSAGVGDLYFADPETLVGGHLRLEQNRPVAERWVSEVQGDRQTLRIERADGAGPFYVHVEGKLARGGPGFTVTPATAGEAALGEPHPGLAPWRKLVGRWRVEGKASPAPGMPMEPFRGEEEMFLLFGGHVVAGHMTGSGGKDAPPYEGWSYLAYDPARNGVVNFAVNNFGFAHVSPCYALEGGRFVFLSTVHVGATPVAWRMVVAPTDEEGVYRAWADRLAGTGKPERSFTAVYRRVASD